MLAENARFWTAVREVLPRYRFLPAMVGGCHVAMTARQPFEFLLR